VVLKSFFFAVDISYHLGLYIVLKTIIQLAGFRDYISI